MLSLTIELSNIHRLIAVSNLLSESGFLTEPVAMPLEMNGTIPGAMVQTPAPRAKKKTEEKEKIAEVEKVTAPIPDITLDPAYKAVADATTGLSRASGRDAVVGLLKSFGVFVDKGQTARNLPHERWAAYVEQARILSAPKAPTGMNAETVSLV